MAIILYLGGIYRRLQLATRECHCGRTAFEIDGELPEKLTRCTCWFCSKRGHLYAYYTPDQLRVTQADSDAIYRWNSKKVANHFCSACGCDIYADGPAFEMDESWDVKPAKSPLTRGCSMTSKRGIGP